MNKKIATAIFGIFLIGIVSAGLITHFAIIIGEVTVSAPVFYLDGLHEDEGVYHKLLIDEIPSEEEIYFWDGNRIIFKTEDLGVNYFYPIELNANIWMKTNNSGNTIQARFLKLDEGNHEEVICEVAYLINITSTSNFYKKEFSCESMGEIDLSDYNRIVLELRGNGNQYQEYWISTGKSYTDDGYSRIEVTAT